MNRRTLMIGATALAGVQGARFANAAARTGSRVFRLIRDGDDIGRHAISAEADGGLVRVSIDIDIAVRIFGFVGYRYTHSNREVWRDGALQSLESTTDDDGDAYRLTVRREGDVLAVDGVDFSGEAPGDAAPTSYWNVENLSKPSWIGTQGGSVLSKSATRVSTDASGLERWDVSGDLTLSLYYDALGEWRGSEFDGQGAVIRYEVIDQGGAFRPLI